MPRAFKVCACTGCSAHPGSCPALCPIGRCTKCARTADRARGSRQQRGYDAEHTRLRATWSPKVDAGQVDCHAETCLEDSRRIPPRAEWDLGHTDDRTGWTGPEHARCNRSAGGRAAHH